MSSNEIWGLIGGLMASGLGFYILFKINEHNERLRKEIEDFK